ncbi:Hypothetical protein HVR_LOCUS1058 [uncultured virus]|nr:Hypothetical protein HVR_LOCUS1058 [uncultured virus]
MSAIVGGGAITTVAGVSYADAPDEIVSGAIGKGEELPDAPEEKTRSLRLSIETIVMSALIFIGILAWFEFLRAWYENVFSLDGTHRYDVVYNRLWYAIFITAIVLIFLYVIYRIANPW